jgi:TIR domain
MARVFISHAHGDEELVRRLTFLLRDALNLQPTDFFVSSQGGRGVAPASNIRDEILKELSSAEALVVVVTPKSADSPWVWLEAGNRLGRADTNNPIFAVPTHSCLSLVQPVADLRCVRLDNEEDLHELIKAVGEHVGGSARNAVDYNVALHDLTRLLWRPPAWRRRSALQPRQSLQEAPSQFDQCGRSTRRQIQA